MVATLGCVLQSLLRYFYPNGVLRHTGPYGLPLPAVKHRIITEEELRGRNIVIIGDVHGCCDELNELLDKCNAKESNKCVIYVGDLMNKGPKSAEVVRLVRETGAYCVRGNHDEVSLREWQTSCEMSAPLPEKFTWLSKLSRDDLRWAFELPYIVSIPSKNIIVVHAGLVPGVELDKQNLTDLIHMRDVKYDNELSRWLARKKVGEDSDPWASKWPGPDHVYFGHDAKRFYQSYQFATGLDTGCVYGGKLTAVYPLEGGHLVEVKSHRIHLDKSVSRNQSKTKLCNGTFNCEL